MDALTSGYKMGSLFRSSNLWSDDTIFFFIFASLRERTIEALTKQSKTQFAAKLFNLLDRSFRGQDLVMTLKQRNAMMNELLTAHQQAGPEGLRSRLLPCRTRSRRRLDNANSMNGNVTRRGFREQIWRVNSSSDSPSMRSEIMPEERAKPSKNLLRILIAEQRQKNQEIEDELRMIKQKLQQEIKARRYDRMYARPLYLYLRPVSPRELQLQLLRRDTNNEEMKRVTDQTLQEWNEVQMIWELMAKQMSSLEQALFFDDESISRLGIFTSYLEVATHCQHLSTLRIVGIRRASLHSRA